MKKASKIVSAVVVFVATIAFATTAQAVTFHYHWYCSVNSYISAKYSSETDCAFNAGAHAQRYDHYKQTTYGSCTSSC